MSNETINQLVNAIALRHSVRTFAPTSAEDALLEKVMKFIDALSLPFDSNVRIHKFTAVPGKGLYNNGVNPPDNLAVFSQTDLVSVSKAGFAGELVMLYMVSLGLSTCWFGHYKLSELGKYVPGISTPERIRESNMGYGYGKHVDVGERVICCVPFGHKDEKARRMMDFLAGRVGKNRKPVETLLEEPNQAKNIPEEIRQVLEAARLAPSAGNSQMWRFGFEDDFKTITVAKPIEYKHFKWEHSDVDIGICAAHIWLELLQKGYEPSVSVQIDADRALWRFHVQS